MSKIRLAIAGIGNCASSLIQGLEYYKNVDEKDELVRCLLRIFCHEIHEAKRNNHKKKDAIFFIIDRWFKDMIEDYMKDTSSPSPPLFEEIHKQLICPSEDLPMSEEKGLDF